MPWGHPCLGDIHAFGTSMPWGRPFLWDIHALGIFVGTSDVPFQRLQCGRADRWVNAPGITCPDKPFQNKPLSENHEPNGR